MPDQFERKHEEPVKMDSREGQDGGLSGVSREMPVATLSIVLSYDHTPFRLL